MNVFIFFCCDWSLNQWKNESLWVYLGLHPHATDTGSLAFNSAMLCRVAVTPFPPRQPPPATHSPPCPHTSLCARVGLGCQVMLSYNVDLLLLAPEAEGYWTPQTTFYCVFAKKSRLIIAGCDTYLLITPLLVLALALTYFLDLCPRCSIFLAECCRVPSFAEMQLGGAVHTQQEKKGQKALRSSIKRIESIRVSSAPQSAETALV